jgi:hypothetical protein
VSKQQDLGASSYQAMTHLRTDLSLQLEMKALTNYTKMLLNWNQDPLAYDLLVAGYQYPDLMLYTVKTIIMFNKWSLDNVADACITFVML